MSNVGKNYETIFYNLDLIISLGYRIKSRIGHATVSTPPFTFSFFPFPP